MSSITVASLHFIETAMQANVVSVPTSFSSPNDISAITNIEMLMYVHNVCVDVTSSFSLVYDSALKHVCSQNSVSFIQVLECTL